LLINIASFGFYPENFNRIKNGMVESAVKAINSNREGKIRVNRGKLFNANIK
jgi:hypothetical protein